MEKAIEERFAEVQKNPHSTMFLGVPNAEGAEGERSGIQVEVKPLAVEVKEASFRMYRKDNRDEVIASHGVPPYRVGVFETGQLAGNLGEEGTKIYKRSIIEPRQDVLEDLINRHIVPAAVRAAVRAAEPGPGPP